MFQDPEANPRKAQLIFTSHDVTLLYTLLGSDRVLQRNTVWLAEKRPDGATDLYPLTSVSPPPARKTTLFRKYLLGTYGDPPGVIRNAGTRDRRATRLSPNLPPGSRRSQPRNGAASAVPAR